MGQSQKPGGPQADYSWFKGWYSQVARFSNFNPYNSSLRDYTQTTRRKLQIET